MRRVLIEAGETLGWAEVAALSDDPVAAVSEDVKKMMKSGVRALERGVAEEVAEKQAEPSRLKAVIASVQELAEDPDVEYPTEIEYSHTAKNGVRGFSTKTETLSVADPEEALRAALRMEKSLPRWQNLSEEALDDLRHQQDTLALVSRKLSDLIEAWRGLLKEVLVTMP